MNRSNATKAFRKLLDERGVEYGPNGEETLIRLDGKTYRIWAYDNERLAMSIAYLTPEQAIAATLGNEREKELESLVMDMYECGKHECNKSCPHRKTGTKQFCEFGSAGWLTERMTVLRLEANYDER